MYFTMTKDLISFPGSAMGHIPREDFPAVSEASHDVVREAKRAGVWVLRGGINEDVPSITVSGDATVSSETYPQTIGFNGGLTVLEVATKEEALRWAAKIAVACRCGQEL